MKVIAQFIKGIKYLDARDWGWAHFKVFIGGVLPIMAILNPPVTVTSGNLDYRLVFTLLIMMSVGGLFSVVGVFLRGTKVQPLIVGYTLELGGLIFLGSGMLLLTTGYFYNSVVSGTSLLGGVFCYSLFAALLARFIDVYFHTLESKKPGDPLIVRE